MATVKMCVVLHNYNEPSVFLKNACLLWLLYYNNTARMKEDETKLLFYILHFLIWCVNLVLCMFLGSLN